MNKNHIRRVAILSTFAVAALAIGCASQVVKENHLKQKTAFALNLDQGDFTISDRVDDGLQTNYKVKTKDGRSYNCYVEGSFSFGTGGVVSDAVCTQVGGGGKTKPKGSTGGACDALSKAAGKC